MRGGQGKKTQAKVWARILEERGETRKGRWKGGAGDGRGQSFVGSGLEAGVALPRHARWSLTHHQAVHP